MTEIHNLEQQAEYYRRMMFKCVDVIKHLNGYTPDNFQFSFTIRGQEVVSIPISEEGGNFCLGVFMSWHQHFSRKLKETTDLINGLRARRLAV